MEHDDFPTTYDYTPLPSPRHIRLLHIHGRGSEDNTETATFEIHVVELPSDEKPFAFETLSYTWGAPKRVASLSFRNEPGVIGLTQNLSQALPHLARTSDTRYIWIDQLCINQNDQQERSHEVSIMDQIYKAASRVIIWLGPADESSIAIKEWVGELNSLLTSRDDASRTIPTREDYNPSVRMLVVRSTWLDPQTDTKFAPAARRFWGRPWFRRGWVVQELLLSPVVLFLAGPDTFTMQNLSDLQTLPADMALPPTVGDDNRDNTSAYNTLLNLKRFPFTDTQPRRFLMYMAEAASSFETTVLVDRLCAFLGLLEGSYFRPDYTRSVRWNFTAFAASLAAQYGSLDFLSLWAANIDAKVESTPEALRGFPSWVPSWTWLPLVAPFRLAIGATRSFFTTVGWDAARGRRHVHDQREDAEETERLHVRGKIIDYISCISEAKIDRYFSDADEAYMDSIVAKIQANLPNSSFESWTCVDLVNFLNNISANGHAPKESAEIILGIEKKQWSTSLVDNVGYNEALSTRLTIGRGRRFATTHHGRMALVPFIGSRPQNNEEKGSAIVVLHGCIVPIVLERVGEGNAWTVVGDCYVEGVMHGEAVCWADNDAEEFILV
ncbi:heterokaryon incompatibility protein [Karstenula rhodostoma CBS 690.94]|uniref:Heterokaryon incompatibility protein n=1 Tax=Karstenula rhodostoma CBS 690.94 TaxID=1392251 RepID=A0A9P4PBS5_9PLEO|nr:heterokaryon incompatibility protein [Karstenula rhodostoma CBS 690.94]